MWRDQLNFAPQGEQTKKNEKTKKNVKREVIYQKQSQFYKWIVDEWDMT